MIDLSQIEKLDIKWPVKFQEANNFYRDAVLLDRNNIPFLAILEKPKEAEILGVILAATLNAFHNDPKRFGELIELK